MQHLMLILFLMFELNSSSYFCQASPVLPQATALTANKNATIDSLDLQAYLGDWYVIASQPTYLEEGCHNAVETYRLRADGDIDNFFSCRMGSFDGPKRNYSAKAWIPNNSNMGEWRVRFFWILTFSYLILEYDSDYQYTVVGYPNFEHVWIMSRKQTMPKELFDGILERLKTRGYDINQIKMVPQSPEQSANK